MKAKQYLLQIKRLNDIIKHREESIELLRVSASGTKAITYDKPQVQTSPEDHSADAIVQYVSLMDELEQERINYYTLRERIIKQIEELPNSMHSALLYKRYVEFKSFEQIAVEMGYDYGYIRNAHGWGLVEFEKKYNL